MDTPVGMCHAFRSRHSLLFHSPASFEEIGKAIRQIPDQFASATMRITDEYLFHLDADGDTLELRLLPGEGVTRIVAAFKSTAQSLLDKFLTIVRRFFPLKAGKESVEPPRPPAPPKPRAPTVAAFLEECLADPLTQGRLVFPEKVRKQARLSPFAHIDQLYLLKQKLLVAVGLMRAGLHAGMPARDFWCREIDLPVTLHLSATQERKYGSDYDVEHDGKILRGRLHVTFGVGHSPADCFSAHFVVCEDCQAIVFTRFGAHGRTARN